MGWAGAIHFGCVSCYELVRQALMRLECTKLRQKSSKGRSWKH